VLLQHGADPNALNCDNKTPLDYAESPAMKTLLQEAEHQAKAKSERQEVERQAIAEAERQEAQRLTKAEAESQDEDFSLRELLKKTRCLDFEEFFSAEMGIEEPADFEYATALNWQTIEERITPIKTNKLKAFLVQSGIEIKDSPSIPMPRQVSSFTEELLLFLSHYKEEANTEARSMKDKLFEKLKQKNPSINKDKLFLDSDNLPKLSVLLERVKKTRNVIFILTKGFFSRPWCLLELVIATNEGKNLVPVKLVSGQRGFDFTKQRQYTHQLSLYLDEVNPGAVQIVQEEGFEITDVENAIRKLMDVIAVELNFSNPENVLDAQFDAIISKLV